MGAKPVDDLVPNVSRPIGNALLCSMKLSHHIFICQYHISQLFWPMDSYFKQRVPPNFGLTNLHWQMTVPCTATVKNTT
jgi:hypothetical protein